MSVKLSYGQCPTADFHFTNTCLGSETMFQDSTSAPNTLVVDWQWDFGDGYTSTVQNPTHIYADTGSYNVSLIVTDTAACSDTTIYTIIISSISIDQILTTEPVCANSCDGYIEIVASGNSGPFEYLWSDAYVGNQHVSVCAGTYYVTISDTNGCWIDTTVTMTSPPELMVAVVSQTNSTCFGFSDGAIFIEVTGGTPPYSYLWNGGPAPTSQNAINLSAGTYMVIVTDANGCTATTSAVISQPTAITVNTTSFEGCDGECSGSATAYAWGGTTPYVYQWNDGGFQTTATANGLCDGWYSITVTDMNGCVGTSVIGVTTGEVFDVSIELSTCLNENGFLDAFANVTGGTPFYSYLWTNGAASPVTQLDIGGYILWVTDTNGCTAADTVIISELPDTCMGMISGYVYSDENDNCTIDSSDSKYSLIPVKAFPGYHIGFTDFNGYYSIPVDTGTYKVSPNMSGVTGYFPCSLQQDSVTVYVSSIDSVISDVNFAYDNNVISGYVYDDSNQDCIFDSTENPLPNILLRLEPAGIYSTTDQSGYYEFEVGLGDYWVTIVYNSSIPQLFNINCPDPDSIVHINFDTCCSSAQNDFSVSYNDCSVLTVYASSQTFRPCFERYIYMSYYNYGIYTVYDAELELELESSMTPVTSTLPWSDYSGNTLTYFIDSIMPMQYYPLHVKVAIDCDNSLIGQTGCVTARIYPDTLCEPASSLWDHSSVSVDGYCANGTQACFYIINTGEPGNGDMQGSSEYRVFANDTLFYTGTFTLAGGDTLELCFNTGGSAIRVEADQRPGHPGNSHPQDIVENCDDPSGSSLGFVNTVPQDDYDPFIDVLCRTYVNSFDPNDKSVVPEGITTQHFIDSLASLEYTIRFQNTGSDTAYTVIVVDTLSEYIDISSFQQGSSSHECTYSISGQGIVTWVFDNIMLPDSTTDEPGSHGLVSFRVDQTVGNDVGDIISNRAGIIFDFNEPIITNYTTSMVWKLPFTIVHIPEVIHTDLSVKVYPNPAMDIVTFHVDNLDKEAGYNLSIYDMLGKEIIVASGSEEGDVNIKVGAFKEGIYLYKIVANGNIASGKIVVKR